MYVWTQGEIAREYGVANGTVSYWLKVWGPDTDHPFPKPVAKVQTRTNSKSGWTLKSLAFNPREVRAWHVGLQAAKSRRMTAAQTGTQKPGAGVQHNAPVSRPMREAVANMETALEALQETRQELERLRVLVASVRTIDRGF
jgi:hypothetical protein